jgi:hypothetical protein
MRPNPMTHPATDRKPLTITLDPKYGQLIRDFAKAQKCTYTSAVCACIQAMLNAGGPVMLDPFGEAATTNPGHAPGRG